MSKTKVCTKCGRRKLAKFFGIRAYGLRSHCKQCEITRILQKRKEVSQVVRQNLLNYLKTHPCVDCGEADLLVLEFDHVRGKKAFTIGKELAGTTTWTRIEKEISKCDVRCANCHRRKTLERSKSFRWLAKEI